MCLYEMQEQLWNILVQGPSCQPSLLFCCLCIQIKVMHSNVLLIGTPYLPEGTAFCFCHHAFWQCSLLSNHAFWQCSLLSMAAMLYAESMAVLWAHFCSAVRRRSQVSFSIWRACKLTERKRAVECKYVG